MKKFKTMAIIWAFISCSSIDKQAIPYDKLTYHNNKQRTGWNPHETQLTPESVSESALGQLWQTPQFDSVDGAEPRLFASPLYVDQLTLSSGPNQGKTVSVVFAATDVGYLYAVNATAVDDIAPGTILWSRRISEERPRGAGNLSTPVIDLERQRIYAVGNDGGRPWRAYALDLVSGEQIENWPVALDSATITTVNRNGGTAHFPTGRFPYQHGGSNPAGRQEVAEKEAGRVGALIPALSYRRRAVIFIAVRPHPRSGAFLFLPKPSHERQHGAGRQVRPDGANSLYRSLGLSCVIQAL